MRNVLAPACTVSQASVQYYMSNPTWNMIISEVALHNILKLFLPINHIVICQEFIALISDVNHDLNVLLGANTTLIHKIWNPFHFPSMPIIPSVTAAFKHSQLPFSWIFPFKCDTFIIRANPEG